MTRTPFHGLSTVALLATLVVACAGPSTRFEQVWREPGAELGPLRRLVTLYESHDGALRRTIEDDMARKLAHEGVRAVPAYSVLDNAILDDHERAKVALAAAGYDGVVAIRLVGGQTEPDPRFDGGWSTTRPMGFEDYVLSSPVVRVETTLYSLRDDQLVWSARSRTVDAENTNQVIDEVTSLVAATLEQHGVAVATNSRRR